MNQKRREQIEEMLQKQKTVTNAELMERFDISIETVRRDLAYLEQKGVIERVYGGAVRKEVVREEPLYVSREEKNNAEKQAIAGAAEALIEDRDIVFFDLGTTVQMVAGKLAENKKIHAFTNAIRTAVTLSEKNCEVILTGGKVRRGELSLSGSLAEANLAHFNIDKAIIGAAGVTEDGISDFIADEAGLRARAIANAGKVVVLADFEKFGVRAMCKVCSLDAIDVLITDEKAPKDMVKMLKKKGIQVIVAKI
ncbi:MAG: DeoR/GlpR transcriptional regulator [Ruminococcaceae bacterium]|nr:DeoR/GlpR transcriptional regulator [Oscillospiraceae bacterium]